MDFDEVCALLGPIKKERLRLRSGDRSDHAPRYVVQRPTFSSLVTMPNFLDRVQIVDFGEAFPASQPRSTLRVPVAWGYFPPELCFGYQASAASDVWELACLMYQTLGTPPPFPCFFPIFEFLVGTAVPILGPLPDHWRARFDYERYGYRENGELKNVDKEDVGWWWDEAMHTKSLRGQMERDLGPRFSPEQLDFLAGLLGDMLVFEPEKRISASEVAQRLHSASTMFGLPASTAEGALHRDSASH
jgi:serine/threonine protein kinase